MEMIGVYVDSTSYPNLSTEVILYYEHFNKIGGTYTLSGKDHQPMEYAPLEDIHLSPDGAISFSVPWGHGNGQIGFEKSYGHFSGRLAGDTLQGTFKSDMSHFVPSFKASKVAIGDLTPDTFQYVRARQRAATENIRKLDDRLACQKRNYQQPNGDIKIVGSWSKVESNGSHQWGYYIIVFMHKDKLYGWMVDYSGISGDPGARYLISDIRLSKKTLMFKAQGAEYGFTVRGTHLQETSYAGITFFDKDRLLLDQEAALDPDVVWKQYQTLNAKCD